jgi:pimeloyl-ACP methyl ester carboxylesterase
MTQSDQNLVKDVSIGERIAENVRENLRQGHRHLQQELLLITRDWGFELSDIQLPVEIWNGKNDPVASWPMVRRLTGELPNCKTHLVADAGHLLLYSSWEEILRTAI